MAAGAVSAARPSAEAGAAAVAAAAPPAAGEAGAMIGRLFRHLFAPSAARLFREESLQRIAEAVARGEATHTGETCFAVESALPLRAVLAGVDARERAEEAFSRLRVWDTAANNGVLVYLLLADHRIEIVADRGFRGRVS